MSQLPQGAIDAAFNLAVTNYRAGDLPGAMDILRLLTLVAPRDQGVWRALARCHEDAGEHEVAEKLRWVGQTIAEETAS